MDEEGVRSENTHFFFSPPNPDPSPSSLLETPSPTKIDIMKYRDKAMARWRRGEEKGGKLDRKDGSKWAQDSESMVDWTN